VSGDQLFLSSMMWYNQRDGLMEYITESDQRYNLENIARG
jgi:hypothetical protein